MKHRQPNPSSPRRVGSRTLRSDDGVVVLMLRRVPAGLFVERTQLRSGGARAIQSAVFADNESFQRWCDADAARLDYPSVYVNLKRDGDALFSHRG